MYPRASEKVSDVKLNVVGGNVFGRNPTISPEQTFNMIISDNALVESPGYKKRINLENRLSGRGIYSSERGNFMIAVVDNVVFKISGSPEFLHEEELFTINSFFGDVFIEENLASQIAICDQNELWIYNYSDGSVVQPVLPINKSGNTIKPGYITYHDGYFIVPDISENEWYLSAVNDGTDWLWGAGGVPVAGSLQTKPDGPIAVLRAPGKGNMIYVFGRNVVEMWYNNGNQLFPYQRSNSSSIDYGCISVTTIAAMDNYLAWLGVNEKSGPVIMISTGSGFQRVSTDGIDYRLADVQHPEQSYAFFFKQDGHVFYQLTFFDESDNFSLLYDFNTGLFSYVTDENMNYHIAEAVAFFNNTYYFVSINDGSIYELNSNFTNYDYSVENPPNSSFVKDIPKVRICKAVRRSDNSRFIMNNLTFLIEQGNDPEYKGSSLFYISGEDGTVITGEVQEGYEGVFLQSQRVVNPYVPRIDLAISNDGGDSFGNYVSQEMNPQGKRRNRVVFWRLGEANDLAVKLRFVSRSRITVLDGVMQARVIS